MGILSSGLRAKIFLRCGGVLRKLVVAVPPNACRGERCGVWGRRAPGDGFKCFLLERFLFSFREPIVFSSGNLLSASAPPQGFRRLHYDVFGSGRGTSTLNLQIELFPSLRGGFEGAPFQRVVLGSEKVFLLSSSSCWGACFRRSALLRAAQVLGPAPARWRFAKGRRPVDGRERQWLSCAPPPKLCDPQGALPSGAALDSSAGSD
jgi:hypothetical protein